MTSVQQALEQTNGKGLVVVGLMLTSDGALRDDDDSLEEEKLVLVTVGGDDDNDDNDDDDADDDGGVLKDDEVMLTDVEVTLTLEGGEYTVKSKFNTVSRKNIRKYRCLPRFLVL